FVSPARAGRRRVDAAIVLQAAQQLVRVACDSAPVELGQVQVAVARRPAGPCVRAPIGATVVARDEVGAREDERVLVGVNVGGRRGAVRAAIDVGDVGPAPAAVGGLIDVVGSDIDDTGVQGVGKDLKVVPSLVHRVAGVVTARRSVQGGDVAARRSPAAAAIGGLDHGLDVTTQV